MTLILVILLTLIVSIVFISSISTLVVGSWLEDLGLLHATGSIIIVALGATMLFVVVPLISLH